MAAPLHGGESPHVPGESKLTPSVWIDVRSQGDFGIAQDRRFVAAIGGLQALKCATLRGYGNTEEEAVLNLRRKVLQFLEFQSAQNTEGIRCCQTWSAEETGP